MIRVEIELSSAMPGPNRVLEVAGAVAEGLVANGADFVVHRITVEEDDA